MAASVVLPPPPAPLLPPSAEVRVIDRAPLASSLEKYTELRYLARVDVEITHEAVPSDECSPSRVLFGEQFIELDRTFLSLKCFELVLDGSRAAHVEFSRCQKAPVLEYTSFEQLHQTALELQRSFPGLSEDEVAEVIRVAIILGDMGKSPSAREIFMPYGAVAPDHDDFYAQMLGVLKDHPDLLPSFSRLTPVQRELLINMEHRTHYGHISHLEGTSSMFSALVHSEVLVRNPRLLDLDFFVHRLDVAGALGHRNGETSLTYNENTHLTLNAVLESCQVALQESKAEVDAYASYLQKRALLSGFKVTDAVGELFVKVLAMCRIYNGDARVDEFLKVFNEELLKSPRIKIFLNVFCDRGSLKIGKTPTYMPAFLLNLYGNETFGESGAKRVLLEGIPFLAKVIDVQGIITKGEASSVPLNFNKMAERAKTCSAELLKGGVSINPDTGEVDIVIFHETDVSEE
jgi:hypothetical protein